MTHFFIGKTFISSGQPFCPNACRNDLFARRNNRFKIICYGSNLHGKKRSNDKDDKLLVKNSLDQTEFLKQVLKIKDATIKMILESYRQTTDYKTQTVKETP